MTAFLFAWLLPVTAGAQGALDVTSSASWDVARLRSSLQPSTGSVSREGDALILLYRGNASSVSVCCGLQLPLRRLRDSGIWALKVVVPDLDRAVLSLDLTIDTPEGSRSLVLAEGGWRGPDAPLAVPPPVVATGSKVQGTLKTVWLADDDLATGGRDVTVYLPPAALANDDMPVLYVMDGGIVEGLMPYLEPLILKGVIAPMAFVGVHSLSGEARWHEYTPGYDAAAYGAMVSFVADIVLPWAETNLQVSSQAGWRGIFGVSNGADFALSMSLRRPLLFGTVIGFSAGTVEPAATAPPADLLSHYYLEAGTLEPDFLRNTSSFDLWLRENGVESHLAERVAGHDFIVWREELVAVLQQRFAGCMGNC